MSAVEASSSVTLVAAFAWFGHFVTAAAFAIGQVLITAFRAQFDASGNPKEGA
ncbi:hypothetical protein BSIN_4037 [Burkholderia singularis]|uniref:Uncharacterized protein n=1 Tax=Burkholderia singularis TaxID=1503053 RepID=A0A238H6J5_9BURK|nr:hypothetical protein BSIN_4037 [Burkholderia singularis]